MGGADPRDGRAAGAGVGRRAFLRGTATAAATAGAGAAAAQDGGAQQVVEMTDQLQFAPSELTVAPGTTVQWENVGSVPHTVTAYGDEIPEDAAYFASGGFESESAAREAYPPEGGIEGGGTYSHTFETPGEYGYFCIPHEQAGMTGTVTVAEEGGGGGGGDAGGGLPDSAKALGVVTVAVMLSTLGLAYFFLKYGGAYGEESER